MGFELLKKRALGFLRNAKSDFEQEDYDLTLFHVDQFVQLYSKYYSIEELVTIQRCTQLLNY